MVGHDGYFGPDSMLHRVQSHHAVGQTYGQRALILGATHPVPYVGTSDSTTAKERPFQRLAGTAIAFETIFFGTRTEADRLLQRVHRMHTRVRGELAHDEGTFTAGTRYDAFDPDLMLWTMAMLADSSRVAFETLVRPLTRDEREELWADWVRFGELFGMPREVAPPDAVAFERWMDDWVAGARMHVTDEAYVVGRAIARDMPTPRHLRPGMWGTNLLVTGMLPARVRELFDLPWTRSHEGAFRSLAAALRGTHRVLPTHRVTGTNTHLHQLVIRTEQARIAAGRPTIDLGAFAER